MNKWNEAVQAALDIVRCQKLPDPITLHGNYSNDQLEAAEKNIRQLFVEERTEVKSVPQALTDLGQLYEERNKLYGDNYKNFGFTLAGIFPQGITLNTPEQFNRFALFLNIIHKATRYGRAMPDGGHADSLDDLAVYAQMAREYDALVKDQQNAFDTEARGG